jgi:hypothetical protein
MGVNVEFIFLVLATDDGLEIFFPILLEVILHRVRD